MNLKALVVLGSVPSECFQKIVAVQHMADNRCVTVSKVGGFAYGHTPIVRQVLDGHYFLEAFRRNGTQDESLQIGWPWLIIFGRGDWQGIAAECLRQYALADPRAHRSVTNFMLGADSPFKADIEALTKGQPMTRRLEAEVQSLCLVPLDDSIAEGPHARAKRIWDACKAARWSWVSSTMRLSQNLEDLKLLPHVTEAVVNDCWFHYKTLLRSESDKHKRRQFRIGQKKFFKRVYNMSHFVGNEVVSGKGGGTRDAVYDPGDDGRLPGDGRLPDDDDDDDDGEVAGDQPPDDNVRGRACGTNGEEVREHAGSRTGATRPLRLEQKRKLSPREQLMRQYMAAALKLHDLVSLPVRGQDGTVDVKFFQVLSLRSRNIHVETFHEEGDTEPLLFEIKVQPYEVWGPTAENLNAIGTAAEIYIAEDPRSVDILTCTGTELENRKYFLKWTAEASDVEGCLHVGSPCVLAPSVKLGSNNIPVLMLLDVLVARGWRAVSHRVAHSRGAALEYDDRRITGKRAYLQCLLSIDALPVDEFPSGKPIPYYQLLLKGKIPRESDSAKDMKFQLAILSEDVLRIAELEEQAPIVQPQGGSGKHRSTWALHRNFCRRMLKTSSIRIQFETIAGRSEGIVDFGGLSGPGAPGSSLDRPGPPRTSICTKNQPRRPSLRPPGSETFKKSVFSSSHAKPLPPGRCEAS